MNELLMFEYIKLMQANSIKCSFVKIYNQFESEWKLLFIKFVKYRRGTWPLLCKFYFIPHDINNPAKCNNKKD